MALIDSDRRKRGGQATGCDSAGNISRDLQMLLTTKKWVTQSQRHNTEPSTKRCVDHSLFILFPPPPFLSVYLHKDDTKYKVKGEAVT